jgi:glycine/D-amino acid oxidase-like deaminating enzyme
MNQVAKLPEDIDVAIIGGGIIGVSTGYALARAGISVAVFEKGTLACEQSSRNWGWVRTLGRDMAEVPLALRAHELWRELQQQVDVGFRQTGILYLAENEADEQKHQDWAARAQSIGVNVQLLDREATLRHLPTTRRPWSGAMFSPTDGVAEPAIATRGIAQLAMAQGCQILEHCAVRGIETSGGRVSGLVTEHGPIKASTVLMAGGAWSRLFCGNLDVDFPQLKVRASVLRTSPIASPMDITINGKDFTCRRRADGGYTVSQFGASYADIVPDSFRLFRHFLPAWLENQSFVKLRLGKRFFEEMAVPRRFAADRVTPFERMRVLDPVASPGAVSSAFRRLAGAFPDFENAQILQSWGGYIDVTPDALPVMCAVESVPGFFLASGFSGHGFGIGPAVGEFMARLIQGHHAAKQTRPFELSRFHRRSSS